MTGGKYIAFNFKGRWPGGTTLWWTVAAKDGAPLGDIRFLTSWRKYAFYPSPGTVFEEQCLRDIATFVEDCTKNRKNALKQEVAHG